MLSWSDMCDMHALALTSSAQVAAPQPIGPELHFVDHAQIELRLYDGHYLLVGKFD